MPERRMPALGDVFAPVELLTVECRIQLMNLLAVPGQPMPILPRQLAAARLPVDPETVTAVRTAIESGLDRSALAAIGSRRLDLVVPALARADPDALIAGAPPRLRGPLARHTGGAPLAQTTIDQLASWPGVGTKRMVQLIGAAVAAAVDAAGGANECLDFFDGALAAAGDERDRGIFENDVLPLGPPVTRSELAQALAISVDRVRRLAARATHRVSAALDQAPPAIGRLAAPVSERLGVAAPLTTANEVLAALGWPALSDTRSRLLLWMVGPYREVDGHPGWIALDESQVGAETMRLIHEDGGLRPHEHVVAELLRVGVNPEHLGDWLTRQPVRISHDLVVALTGSPGDVAERALHAAGRAMSAVELTEWVPGGGRAVQALFTAGDRRFQFARGDRLALVEWGEVTDTASA